MTENGVTAWNGVSPFAEEDSKRTRDRVFRELEQLLSKLRGAPVRIDEHVYARLRERGIGGNWREWQADLVTQFAETLYDDVAEAARDSSDDLLAAVGAVSPSQPVGIPIDIPHEPPPWWRIHERLLHELHSGDRIAALGALGLSEPVPLEDARPALLRFAQDRRTMQALSVESVGRLRVWLSEETHLGLEVWLAYLRPDSVDLLTARARENGHQSESAYLDSLSTAERDIWRQTLVPNPLVSLYFSIKDVRRLVGCAEQTAFEYLVCGEPLRAPYLSATLLKSSNQIEVRASVWADPRAVAALVRDAGTEAKPPRLTSETVDFILAYREIEQSGVRGKQQRYKALPAEMQERFAAAKDPAASAFSQYRNGIRSVRRAIRLSEPDERLIDKLLDARRGEIEEVKRAHAELMQRADEAHARLEEGAGDGTGEG